MGRENKKGMAERTKKGMGRESKKNMGRENKKGIGTENKKNLFRKTAQYFLDTTYLRSRYNSIMVQDIEKYYIT